MDFASRLKELLHDRGIAQKDFANGIDIAPSTAGNYVRGLREPDYETLRACLISSDEDGNEGKSKNLSRNNEFTLTIFPKPAEFVQPAEKALYHPTMRQYNKSV